MGDNHTLDVLRRSVVINYDSLYQNTRQWLLKDGYPRSVAALDWASRHHDGLRKDGVTHEFCHQLEMVNYARVIPIPKQYREDIYTTIALHDVVEDGYATCEEIVKMFGNVIEKAVYFLSKNVDGWMIRKEEDYFEEMAGNLLASIVKGIDQIHNFQTMQGAFTEKKQRQYVHRGIHHTIPMLRRARRNFGECGLVYDNLETVIFGQMELISYIHGWNE